MESVDDLKLGISTLLAALNMKLGRIDDLDKVVRAWSVRGLVPGIKGYWEQFGPWWEQFLGVDLQKHEIVKAFLA